jgi:ribosomal protein L37AE/L43A
MSAHPDPRNPSFAERWRRSQDEVSRLRAENMREATPIPDDGSAPARCPVCRSQDVKTTSKVLNADTYWRCGGCGEVWNVARHRAGSRYARDLGFRR